MATSQRPHRDLAAAVAEVPAWYHTLDLGSGVVTPGYFDLRSTVGRLPWPDVRGKRCLDVGTYDGFYAFELERRGAAEVVAIDVADPDAWDWPPDARADGPAAAKRATAGQHAGGFEVAREALGSSVERVRMTIYELSPERVGRFDVITCGSLLLHLRDPLRALEAVRTVCSGALMSCEEIRSRLTLAHPRRALARLDGSGQALQWSIPNLAGHRRMLHVAGFEVESAAAPYRIPFGVSHPSRQARRRRSGVLHSAVRAAPRV